MPTVIFYCSILLFSTLFIYLREKGKGKLEYYFFTSLAFLLVFIPSAIRYDIGTDYLSYENIYHKLEYYNEIEPAFYFINTFLKSINASAQWMFATFAFIFTYVFFRAYPRKNAWLFHFVFISILWFFSFNGIRQATALAFSALALLFYFRGFYLKFFLLILVASLFHLSAIFIGIVGLIASLPLSSFLKAKIMPNFFIIGLLTTFFLSTFVIAYIEKFLALLSMEKYASYFQNSNHFIETDFGSGLGILAKVLFVVYFIYSSNVVLSKNKNYWIVVILSFLYGVGIILAGKIVIFSRMGDTFSIALIFSVYLLYKFDFKNIITKSVVLLFLGFLFISYIKLGFGVETPYGDPKRNPYVSIFSK